MTSKLVWVHLSKQEGGGTGFLYFKSTLSPKPLGNSAPLWPLANNTKNNDTSKVFSYRCGTFSSKIRGKNTFWNKQRQTTAIGAMFDKIYALYSDQ